MILYQCWCRKKDRLQIIALKEIKIPWIHQNKIWVIILDCFRWIFYHFSFENYTLFREYHNHHHYNTKKIIGHKIENQTNILLIIFIFCILFISEFDCNLIINTIIYFYYFRFSFHTNRIIPMESHCDYTGQLFTIIHSKVLKEKVFTTQLF